MNKPVYLDYASTTPVDPRVRDVLLQYLTSDGVYGNPASTLHTYGWEAQTAVDAARTHVADLLHADADDILFTSGATESINLAIKGVMSFYARKGKHIVTMLTEHKAVLNTVEYVERQGAEVTYLKPLPSGVIDLAALASAIRDDTVLVSILHVNNETGVIQPLQAIADIVKQKNAFLHVDAAQSAGILPLDMTTCPVDLLSLSGHKLYAPKGIGALYVRSKPRVRLTPQMHGAGQERGLRSGTLPVAHIAALGHACAIVQQQRESDWQHYQVLREHFLSRVTYLPGIHVNGETCVPNIVSLSVEGVDGTQLLSSLSEHIAVSTGAACASASLEPSHVLRAMGVPIALAQATVRFSFGRETTMDHIRLAADVFVATVARCRNTP